LLAGNSEVHMGLLKVSTMALPVMFILNCSASEPPPPKTNVFDPLTKQLDRARDVQNTVNENADATRKALDAQERGDTSR
jgi:hypothetical protein